MLEQNGSVDFDTILSAAGETGYYWDLRNDSLRWAPNACAILGVTCRDSISTGRSFYHCIDPEDAYNRFCAIMGTRGEDHGKGVAYSVRYRMITGQQRHNREPFWVEERGRWYSASNGRPTAAYGIIRVLNDRFNEDHGAQSTEDYDYLTGQMNRSRLTELIDEALASAHETGESKAFVLLSIKNMAVVNESFGFDIGDQVIAGVGRRLRALLRKPDCVGRYCTNKFGIVLHDCDAHKMNNTAERLIEALGETPIETTAGIVAVNVSMGGVQMPKYARTLDATMSHALESHNQARVKRFDHFTAYHPSTSKENLRRQNMVIADEVLHALNDHRMLLALQPIVHAKSLQPAFHECLLRLRAPNGELVSAGKFIPISEKVGLSRMIDHRVLEMAITLARSLPHLTLSVNVSGLTANDHSWISHLRTLLRGNEALAQRLIVEITETAAIQDISESVRFVENIKRLGCRVAIDDFGAGYTSFRNLKMLGVDMVKLDGTFVENCVKNADDQLFVKTLIDLARNFGLETVAEWVEDEPTACLLREIGVNFMQGYHYGKPVLVDPGYPNTLTDLLNQVA